MPSFYWPVYVLPSAHVKMTWPWCSPFLFLLPVYGMLLACRGLA